MKILDLLKKELSDGKIFSVQFRKKDGSIRDMTARLGVKSHLKGGELSYNPSDYNNLIVFDMQKKAYRTVSLDNIIHIKFKGEVYSKE